MERSLSNYDYLKQRLAGTMKKKKSMFSLFFETDYRYIEINIPYYDYLRGEVLINDVKTIADDAPDIDLGKLIALLYVQFLLQIRKGFPIKQVGQFLNGKKLEYITPEKQESRTMEVISNGQSTFWDYEEKDQVTENMKSAYLTVRMKKAEIYRGEILLYDLKNLNDTFEMTIEEMLAILYLDFIHKIKSEGNNEKTMKSIIKSVKWYTDI
ncbi:hypothetical protein [Alkalihalobacillus sp. TS-13]|uniref:hypothetical protein n=1 Tax=Alkalihalobacillus sp. TS-13 TaxID=2842455 RepID=UPI001C87B20C|nr:hypothetical protein [Alkalihalobacillus sp. TS-13]